MTKQKIQPVKGKTFKFILFISGMSGRSMNAVENLRKICEKHMTDDFETEIIDINIDKEQAARYQIIGIPTLIKKEPTPPRTILGDLSDTNKVLTILNIAV